MNLHIPRILLAAPSSGSGKTTVACGILKALSEGPHQPMAFKCGPDYIDPMFHSKVLGLHSRNLDTFLMSENTMKYLFADNMRRFLLDNKEGIALVEGVMGYYDGLSGQDTAASTYNIARITNTPVILILDGKGASLSLAATIKGFANFRKDSGIRGVLLNRINPGTYAMLKNRLEEETGIPILGFMPEIQEAVIKSRHLGLIKADEIHDLELKLSLLGRQARETIDLEAILQLAKEAEPLTYEEVKTEIIAEVRIAVAQDEAFCFYYKDSLELLERMGAHLIPFSPMHDNQIPECDGIYIGGGYPELYIEKLSKNHAMKENLSQHIGKGMPCIAECGGFMYLLSQFMDAAGESRELAGVIDGSSRMTTKLRRFGYVCLEAKKDNLLCKEGDRIHAHEFHYSDSDQPGDAFHAVKPSGKSWTCIHGTNTLFAGYPHLHLWGNPSFGENFIKACSKYKRRRHSNES